LKKKWHEETVFRNQMVGVQKDRKRFINDTVRSDFHKKFLSRFVQ
jgi:protein CWC15